MNNNNLCYSREPQIELTNIVYNPAAEFEKHEISQDEDQGDTFYAESIDSSSSEHLDTTVSGVEVTTSVTISVQA